MQKLLEHLRIVREREIARAFIAREPEPDAAHHAHHAVVAETTVSHRGHIITVRRTYEILVDADRLDLPVAVDRQGRVSCHGLPYVSFESATDLVKAVLDEFPEVSAAGHDHEEADDGPH